VPGGCVLLIGCRGVGSPVVQPLIDQSEPEEALSE
jgi:hypothetical protein